MLRCSMSPQGLFYAHIVQPGGGAATCVWKPDPYGGRRNQPEKKPVMLYVERGVKSHKGPKKRPRHIMPSSGRGEARSQEGTYRRQKKGCKGRTGQKSGEMRRCRRCLQLTPYYSYWLCKHNGRATKGAHTKEDTRSKPVRGLRVCIRSGMSY